ncbi:MAG: hypothetical protein K6G38_05785 [Gammaproteobacteria bacterium]|nr:hypothetical protein [Gammaproteobacteria bacterium]
MNDNELSIFDKAVIAIIPFTIVVSIIIYFVSKNNNAEVKSLVVSSLTSIVLNYWNYKLTFKVSEKNYQKLKLYTVLSFITRYAVIGILVFVACYFFEYNLIYMLFGVLEYPLFLMIFGSFEGGIGGGRKRKND